MRVWICCALSRLLDRGGFGYSFVIWEGGVCQNPLSSMNQQVTGLGNSWLCVGSVVLFKWIIFVSISFTRWLGVCNLWCESLLSFTFSLYQIFIKILPFGSFIHIITLSGISFRFPPSVPPPLAGHGIMKRRGGGRRNGRWNKSASCRYHQITHSFIP